MAWKLNLNPTPEPKCKHCKRKRGEHKARSLHCPVGIRTRVGFLDFSKDQVYEPIEPRKKKG